MNDKCVLCLNGIQKNTKEHVPSRAMGNKGTVEYSYVFQEMAGEGGRKKKGQNGLWFKSTCAKCNNEKQNVFSVPLVEFQNALKKRFELFSKLNFFEYNHQFEVNGAYIARALVGMYLASDRTRWDDTEDGIFREYYKGNRPDLRPFRIFAWLHAHPEMRIDHDIPSFSIPTKTLTRILFALKSYPLGLLIADNSEGFSDLVPIDETKEKDVISINLAPKFSKNFPLVVDQQNFIICGKAGMKSVEIVNANG